MPLSWNEIKTRAQIFAKHWANAGNENAQAKPFLIAFFEIFGITDKRIASFEHAVTKYGGERGYVDLFWPGILLVEMKSRGKNLDRAHSQALDYFAGIKERDLPRYVLVCDFARFRLYDLTTATVSEFILADLPQNIRLFGFIAGYQTQVIKPQDPINIRAAERMGLLHDQMRAVGYSGHALELYLVRLLFCLFAEDTGIFDKRQLHEYIEQRTAADGADLAYHLDTLFFVLNTPHEQRLKNLDEAVAAFPFINGKLFATRLPPAGFDSAMRESLLELCAIDWSLISPAIFGSLFQSIMDKQARRNLGAHYTSEENILKLIKPLFLDELWAEFAKISKSKPKLVEFHKKLRTLNFLDPACGCGNFLVITYRELRLLELEILRVLRDNGQLALDVKEIVVVDVDQFHGIEIEDFPAQIAQVALWLTDHQMNLKVSQEFGTYFVRIPLLTSGNIVHGNALRLDWEEVLPAERCSYILGNPPFVGKAYQSAIQKADMQAVCANVNNAGLLDFVAAWYIKATNYMTTNSIIRAAFVSTNSITQGEQVGILWSWLLSQGIKIHFAHRTFAWSNEARGKATVYCVIIGFGLDDIASKTIFEYENSKGIPQAIKANNINPYLVDAPNVLIKGRNMPICLVSKMENGGKPTDGGNLLLSNEEKITLLEKEPQAEKWIRPYLMGEEFINGIFRWCLWLIDVSPTELRNMPHVMRRIDSVKTMRLNSTKVATVKLASIPFRFGEIKQPYSQRYIAVPKVSSGRRQFIPIGYLESSVICGDKIFFISDSNLVIFGILSSTMHNAWMRSVCGRLGNGYSYSNTIVYNNYPWPEPTDKQRTAIESAAQGVLDARTVHTGASLADLYDPLTMPINLLKAHQKLDHAVDTAYGYIGAPTDAARVAFLFELYQKLTSLLPAEKPVKKTRRKTTIKGAI